jgi:hypothetical protein
LAAYARLWLVQRDGDRPAVALLPALAPLARAPQPAPAAGDGAALRAWLQALAAQHAGLNVLVEGELELLQACAAIVLGIPGRAFAARTLTVDWPLGDGAPQLVGVDLDWAPPPALARARFPGGPGAGR